MIRSMQLGALAFAFVAPLAGAADARDLAEALERALDVAAVGDNARGGERASFVLPHARELDRLPQDPKNPLTSGKVALGRMLFHDTAFGTETADPWRSGSYGCATCHHVAAGFKAGIPQGIADGGVGFGALGRDRRLGTGLDANAVDGDPLKPDVQPVASPTTLNAAWTSVVLWDGALGNGSGGANAHLDPDRVLGAGPPPVKANRFGLAGLETQALAGTHVHRLRFDDGSLLQTNRRYRRLWTAAYPNGVTNMPDVADSNVSEENYGAALAIAAYERTLTASRAPFQRFLRGQRRAMTARQIKGALLFFGKAGCSDCHTGPALASRAGAPDTEVFMSVGFADLDTTRRRVHGTVPANAANGRGGFTGLETDTDRFKVPQLYNLRDARVLGHGASFRTVREVIEYKNAGIPQDAGVANLDARFAPLGLSERERRRLTDFVKNALYDPRLSRHVPRRVPSGECFPANDVASMVDGGC